MASAASAIRGMTAKQPTRTAATATVMETTSAPISRGMDVELHRFAVELMQALGRQDRLGRPHARVCMAEAENIRRVAIDHAEVVRNQENCQPLLLLHAPDELVELLLPWLVHAGSGLIEQEHGRA